VTRFPSHSLSLLSPSSSSNHEIEDDEDEDDVVKNVMIELQLRGITMNKMTKNGLKSRVKMVKKLKKRNILRELGEIMIPLSSLHSSSH